MEKAWFTFFGTGWMYGKEPAKRDCFEAGYKAAMIDARFEQRKIIIESDPDEVAQKIREWQEKFNSELV